MYVCHCAVVTDRDVLESIANGARCVADVARQTGAGRTCGELHQLAARPRVPALPGPSRARRRVWPSSTPSRELGVAGAAR